MPTSASWNRRRRPPDRSPPSQTSPWGRARPGAYTTASPNADWWNHRPEETVSLGVSPAGVQYHNAEVQYKPVDGAEAPGRGPSPGAPGASVFTHARALGKISLFGGLGGFLFGYDTGVISGALLFIREEFGTGPWTEGLIVGVTSLGALAGAVFGGTASDRHGRKRVVLFCDALYLIGAMIMSFSLDVFSLCVGRLVAGLAVGVLRQHRCTSPSSRPGAFEDR